MRGSMAVALAFVGLAGWSLAAAGQAPRGQVNNNGTARRAQTVRLPYTAEFKTTTVQTLANGSTVTHETAEIIARDSQGRQMMSSTSTPTLEGQTVLTMVNINDPVGRTHSFWTVPGQRATVTNVPAPDAAPASCAAANPPAPRTEEKQRARLTPEDLGTQTFQGLEARGHRTTRTIPAASIGNSDVLVHTDEVWFSTTPGFSGINVHQVNDDPLRGTTTRELVRFTQGEPDAALFQLPQDYEVVIQETHDEVRCPQ